MILSVHGGLFRGVFFGTAFSIGETRTELTQFPQNAPPHTVFLAPW